jgi:hypothetical protein
MISGRDKSPMLVINGSLIKTLSTPSVGILVGGLPTLTRLETNDFRCQTETPDLF